MKQILRMYAEDSLDKVLQNKITKPGLSKRDKETLMLLLEASPRRKVAGTKCLP